MKSLTVLLFACGALLTGCAEGPTHYTEGGEFHGNTPHNDDNRSEIVGGQRDHDRDHNQE